MLQLSQGPFSWKLKLHVSSQIYIVHSKYCFFHLIIVLIFAYFSSSCINYSCIRFLALWWKVSLQHYIWYFEYLVHTELSQSWLLLGVSCLSLGFISAFYPDGLTYPMLPDYFSCWDAFLLNQKEEGRNFMRFVPSLNSLSNGLWTWC